MSECRDPSAGAALKTAFKLLIGDVGGLDAGAACTRVARSQLGDYGNRAMDKFPPADVILDLERCAQEPRVTATLARLQGYCLMPVQLGANGTVGQTMEQVAGRSGTLLMTTVRALADGVVTDDENEELDQGLDELIRVAMAARGVLRGMRNPARPTLAAVPAQAAE